jgi:sulfur transfer protein SufE
MGQGATAGMSALAGNFASRQDGLVATLQALPDPQQRLSWVVEQARRGPPVPAHLRTAERLVPGCAARLWLSAELDRGNCHFACDSDSAILKAIATVLCTLYSGLAPAEVESGEPDFLRSTGLLSQFTENRQKTIARVRTAIREFAAQQRG